MSNSKPDAEAAGPHAGGKRRNHALRARFERHRALHSAWGVLAPSGLSSEGQHIAQSGRAMRESLAELARQSPDAQDEAALGVLDKRLDALENELRTIVFEVPLPQLRSTLPERVQLDRRGVLDLLDLMLTAEIDGCEGGAGRVAAIDYLITLLCTCAEEPGVALEDPVTLTPRLYGLCERAAAAGDPGLPDIEAEFFAAAAMDADAARAEVEHRTLRRRKTELGESFFAPGVLRAIVAYNAALWGRLAQEIRDSQDWGSLPAGGAAPAETGSVFDAAVLLRLAEALRRRAAGEPPGANALDRIAWCLDLGYPDESEREALLARSVGQRDDVRGTAILVGLLCRAAVVLEEELPAICIAPEQLTGSWVQELDDALKQEVNGRIAGDGYRDACLISELRSKFLWAPMAEVHRKNRGSAPIASEPGPDPGDDRAEVRREARQLADDALESEPEPSSPEPVVAWHDWQTWPWTRLASIAGGAVAAVTLLLWIVGSLQPAGDLVRLRGAELDRISPHLERGQRNGEGTGPAFVGTIGERWSDLSPVEQERAAAELVRALRSQGVREIMVYDDERRLRIQALGKQAPRVLAAR